MAPESFPMYKMQDTNQSIGNLVDGMIEIHIQHRPTIRAMTNRGRSGHSYYCCDYSDEMTVGDNWLLDRSHDDG